MQGQTPYLIHYIYCLRARVVYGFRIVTRKAAVDCVYGKVKIPAGMNVQVDVWGLHHDSDLWEDPQTFEPER